MNTDSVKTLYKKSPVGFIATAVAIVLFAAYFYRHGALSEMQAHVEQRTADGQRQAANINFANQLDLQLQAIETANSTVSSRLINPNDLANNLQYFYKLESEAGVKLLNTPRPASETVKSVKGVYVPVQYAVSVQGSYKQVLTFLRKMEQGVYYCRVKGAVCSEAQKTNESAQAEVVLSLTVELLGRA
ncbi:MAG: hypothetical protein IPP19_16185 [Verrucomicrobia bacterium]|nr:hypothetical protein [Verrucomicrobiota bacterium]